MSQSSAIRRTGKYVDPYSGINMSDAVLQNAPVAYQNALVRDQKVIDDKATAENTRQFNANLSLSREAMDRNSEDSKRASIIGGVQVAASIPGWTDKVFGSGGTKDAIDAPLAKAADSGGFLESVRTGASDIVGDKAASGITTRGIGQAGVGALAGGLIGGNELERGLIGAAVPLAWNIGSALMSDGGSVIDAVSESIFPSIGAGLGAAFGF